LSEPVKVVERDAVPNNALMLHVTARRWFGWTHRHIAHYYSTENE